MARKDFKKGDKVTLFSSWDNRGTVSYVQAIVHSCGTKQMVLTNEHTGEELGRHFSPERGTLETVGAFNWKGTTPRMTEEEAEAFCLKVGERVVDLQRVHFALCIERNEGNRRYIEAIQSDIDALHEPRALDRTGKYNSKPNY